MKLKKKISSVILSMVLGVTLLTGCAGNTDNAKTDENIKIGMITDVGGVNDQSYNQSAWEGLERAEEELGVEVNYLESQQDADYVTNIETMVDNENDLIIGVGFKMADAIYQAAQDYPDQKFAIIDHNYEEEGKEIPENLKCILFNEKDASYLVGLVAGKMTKTNKVAFIGGMESPVIARFQYGYMAGVKDANPNVEAISQYANSFSDAAKGKSIANQMYASGTDIIFIAAGNVGTGSIEAAKETNKFAIGVDRDQNDLAPNNVITSAMKRVDVGVYETAKELKDNNFGGGQAKVYGLNEGAVGLAPTSEKLVSKEILDFAKQQEEKIKNGEIKVPATEKEYKAYIK